MRKKTYSLRKSRTILKDACRWYKRKGHTLQKLLLNSFEEMLADLDRSVMALDRPKAALLAEDVEVFMNNHAKKSVFTKAAELAGALIFALCIAIVVRQMWFELYQIPTGSMRPTFKEQDHLTVSKTAFGLNVPLSTSHFYFDPELIKRAGVIIWSGDHVPNLGDVETTYFGIFPYTKRYIKRLIGKPGDTLYFYGGQIYGLDHDGKPIEDLLNSPLMAGLEHIPFMTFEGEVNGNGYNKIEYQQVNQALGRSTFTRFGSTQGEVFNGKEWVADLPDAQNHIHDTIETYSDLFGMRNFAMARLLSKEQLTELTSFSPKGLEDAALYLELRHTPTTAHTQFLPAGNGMMVSLDPYVTMIPLQKHHLDELMQNMYTGRFIVRKELAYPYNGFLSANSPRFPNVPDGTYEFDHGVALKVGFKGWTSPLPPDHPLYRHNPDNIQRLFNLGVMMNTMFSPHSTTQLAFPHRYAYFRNGDLYLMGAPILRKEDPTLVTFIKNEQERESARYVPFQDYGPPIKDGALNKTFIKTFGLKIPEGHYLVLGDNHANSADSRVCGFIPEANLQGVSSLLIWPPGSRWGLLPSPYAIFVFPRLFVWMVVILIASGWYFWHRWSWRKPLFHRLPPPSKNHSRCEFSEEV